MAIAKDKRKILWVTIVNGMPSVIAERKVLSSEDRVTFRRLKGADSFHLDASRPTFRKKNTFYYFVDIKKGQLFFGENENKVSSQMMNTVWNQEAIRQIISGLESTKFMQILPYILLAGGMFLAVGYILGNAVPL